MAVPAEVLSAAAPAAREAAKKAVELIVIEGGKSAAKQAALQGARAATLRGAAGLLRTAAARAFGGVGAAATVVLWPTSLNEGEDEWLQARDRYDAIPYFSPDLIENCPECEDREKHCIVGPYGQIKNLCPGGQAHHIVPDFTLRYGTRTESERGEKRIPNMPSFDDSPAICLEGHASVPGTEHYRAQKQGDAAIGQLGVYQTKLYPQIPPGTAPLGKVATVSALHTVSIKPHCAKEIAAAVGSAFRQTDLDQLVRTTTMPPTGETLNALRNGNKFQDYRPHL